MIAAFSSPGSPLPGPSVEFAGLLRFEHDWVATSGVVPGGAFAYCLPRKVLNRELPLAASEGRYVLFNGDFYNRRQIAAQLGMPADSPAQVYAAALGAWGDAVDEHIIGHYCTISCLAEGVFRLARSPFYAPPLHFRNDAGRIIASSSVRSLFWREENTREIDLERLSRTLILDYSDRFAGPYKACKKVPLGCSINVTASEFHEIWNYDLLCRPRIRFKRDEDYVEAALALLDEGVAAALEGSERPAIMISGGLDSTTVAASALRQLPKGGTLYGLTHDPDDGWTGKIPPGRYVREFPAVQRFAEQYPALKIERMTNPGRDFRYRQRDVMQAMDQAVVGSGISFEHLAAYEAAQEKGCDLMLTGSMGNLTFSNDGSWGYVEYLLKGRWLQLWRAYKHMPTATRPKWQHFFSLSVLPLLPDRLWHLAMYFRPRGRWKREDCYAVAPDWMQRHQLAERAKSARIDLRRSSMTSPNSYWRILLAQDNQEFDEIEQAYRQFFGIRTHDPTAYRPLVEFCHGLPTDQFLRDGVPRWLARRMAEGRIPDDIRMNAHRGLNQVDWPIRLRCMRHDLIEEIDRMADDPDIAAVIDLPRLRRLLTEFPDNDEDILDSGPYLMALPVGICAGRFIAYAKGRNDI